MNPLRKTLLGAAVVGATLTGGAIGVNFLGSTANAQSTDTSATTSASDTSGASAAQTPATSASPAAPAAPSGQRQGRPGGGQFDPSKGGHVANGITEALLTGDTADKATAAAKAAVPDGTIERVENDAEGAVYEAHMVKADGSHVTVKLGADFAVTSIEDGMR
jgi:hypothetical protein